MSESNVSGSSGPKQKRQNEPYGDVPWRSPLDFACNALQLEVVGLSSVLALRRRTATLQPQRVALGFESTPVAEALDVWCKVTGGSFVIDPKVTGELSLWANQVDEHGLLMALADAVHADLSIHAPSRRGRTRASSST